MNEKLQDLRRKIDQIDDEILRLLKERVDLMEIIGKLKKQGNLSVRDVKREKEKLKIIDEKAKKLGLPADLTAQLWTFLFTYSEEIEK